MEVILHRWLTVCLAISFRLRLRLGVRQTLGSLSLFVLPRSLSWLMYIVAPLIGLAGTSMLVTVISMTSDFIGKKSSVSAKVFGLYSFSDKLCSGIAVYIIQGCISCGDCCTHESCCR